MEPSVMEIIREIERSPAFAERVARTFLKRAFALGIFFDLDGDYLIFGAEIEPPEEFMDIIAQFRGYIEGFLSMESPSELIH